MNHLHGHDTFPRKKVNLIGSWSVEKFSNFQRNRKKKSQADPIWRMVKAARGLWRGKRDRNEKKKRKNPSSNSNWPGSWTERFSRSICIFARPSAAAGLSFSLFLKKKISISEGKFYFRTRLRALFFSDGNVFQMASPTGGTFHFLFDIIWRISGHKFKLREAAILDALA